MNEKFRFVTGILCGLLIVIYIAQLLFPQLTYFLALSVSNFIIHPWTLLTSIFVHSPSDVLHLLNNLFFLLVFGTLLEKLIGSKKFIIVFLSGGIIANLSAFTFYQHSIVLGASGAISTVVLALTILRPKMVGLYFGVPMRMYLVAILWFLNNVLLTFIGGNIATEAHLYGGAFGILIGVYLRSIIKIPKDPRSVNQEKEDPSEREVSDWEDTYMK